MKRRRAVLRTEEDKFGVITRRASIRLDLQGGPRGTSSAMEAQAEEGKGRTKRSNSAVDKVHFFFLESFLSFFHSLIRVVVLDGDIAFVVPQFKKTKECNEAETRDLDYGSTPEYHVRGDPTSPWRRSKHEIIRRL